ncbi:MAG: class I SAM-dependent methyltransferase [Candidatus Eiseniibacteriota bacterium]|nr:MAG: class I SAM-dependent methyltransferase [Candidatus Eisenbacteria bacterium]
MREQEGRTPQVAMRVSERVCLLLNALFPGRKRTGRTSPRSYSEAEYRWARGSLALHAPHIDLNGKTVLDAGCGLGGKTVFYAEHGCASIVGVDIDENHVRYAADFATSRNVSNASFVRADLGALPFEPDTFDFVVLNDVVEHLRKPILTRALEECRRVICTGGRIFLEFPPWASPDAAHLYDYIHIPWCHLLFSPETLVNVTQRMNPEPRYGKLSVIEHFQELNQITVEEFLGLVRALDFRVINFEIRMIRNLKVLKYVPVLSKYLISRAVAVLSK